MSFEPLTAILVGTGLMAVVMIVLWLVQRRTGDAGIVDVGWSAGIGVLAILFAVLVPGEPFRKAVVATLTVLWSFRLAGYVAYRAHGKPEDGRYASLREQFGDRVQMFFLGFFLLQGLLDVVFALPPLVAMLAPREEAVFLPWDYLGIAIGLLAVIGEGTADAQLDRWRSNPANKGKTCRAGLWRYSRHPNYFFEWLHWWAYVLLGIGSPYWWATLVAPALMLYFLFRVTGIPATEAHALKSRGDDYRRYQQATSPFVPWFPAAEPVGETNADTSPSPDSEKN